MNSIEVNFSLLLLLFVIRKLEKTFVSFCFISRGPQHLGNGFPSPSPALLCKNSRKQREQTQCEKTLGELLRNRPRRRFPSLNQSRVCGALCCTCVSSSQNKRERREKGGHTPVFSRGERRARGGEQSLVIIIHYTLLIAERPDTSLSLSFTSTYTVYSALTIRSILFKGGV